MAPTLRDLPDFLHNSPYIPVAPFDIDEPQPKPVKPTLKEILRSRPVRTSIPIVICFLVILALLPHGIPKARELHIQYKTPACLKQDPVEVVPLTGEEKDIDWGQYAYITYATSKDHLCNALMLFESLNRLESKAARVLLYRQQWKDEWVEDKNGKGMEIMTEMLIQARDEYGVSLVNVEVLSHRHSPGDSYTKFLAWNQTDYTRLIVLDSDSTILQSMDELFFAPMDEKTELLAPRAYWLDASGVPSLASHIMLIKPSLEEYIRLENEVVLAGRNTYDMDIINAIFTEQQDACGLIDHRTYALLTGEFRRPVDKHRGFWGKPKKGEEGVKKVWDPQEVLANSKFVHFSDWPLRKPWEMKDLEWLGKGPKCVEAEEGDDCRGRDIWNGFYEDFRERRVIQGIARDFDDTDDKDDIWVAERESGTPDDQRN
ncbi:hypothetical protein CJF30_00008737 [Rutstroemia sp. NJR-2017a BBW]|nr:hypothetical protein CJF30_00008737 [Rutstroemia sp. NJR-2017a BBW]